MNLPRHFATLFTLNDLNLEYFDGYIYAGVTPSFTPHAKPPEHDLMHAFEQPYPQFPGVMNGDRTFYEGNEFRFINNQ